MVFSVSTGIPLIPPVYILQVGLSFLKNIIIQIIYKHLKYLILGRIIQVSHRQMIKLFKYSNKQDCAVVDSIIIVIIVVAAVIIGLDILS